MENISTKFDSETIKILKEMADDQGISLQAIIRQSVRLNKYISDRMMEGYQIALLKEGIDPVLVEFEKD